MSIANLKMAFPYFKKNGLIDEDEFGTQVWENKMGPTLVEMKKRGWVFNRYSIENDYPIASDLLSKGKTERAKHR